MELVLNAILLNFCNKLNYFRFFPQHFPSWIRIRILNADPYLGGQMNADPDPHTVSQMVLRHDLTIIHCVREKAFLACTQLNSTSLPIKLKSLVPSLRLR